MDDEYSRGVWDYLRDVSELPRFGVVAAYCHHFRDGGTILEIGCGEGILQERLCPARYSRYVGLDVSSEAIQRASRKANHKTVFLSDDAERYRPDEPFDVIVFNECLEYFSRPLDLLLRYEGFLRPGGRFVVSMFVGLDTVRTKRIWKMLDSVYAAEAQAQVKTRDDRTWIIRVYSPRARRPGRDPVKQSAITDLPPNS